MANRRGIDERLAYEWERARRHRRPLSIIMLDVDGLKGVNDTDGHAAGDEVLRRLAQELKALVRSIDFVGRIGGDEFLVVCVESDHEAARVVGGKILAGLSAPVSLGLASLRVGQTMQQLMLAADLALYGAKQAHQGGIAPPLSPELAEGSRRGERGG